MQKRQMQQNNEKLTKEFCKNKTLIFQPETDDEAQFIQEQLFRMGFSWPDDIKRIQHLYECVVEGMVLNAEGTIYYNPDSDNLEKGILCNSNQFDTESLKDSLEHLSGDKLTIEAFNRLSKQMSDQFSEISKHVKKLEGEIEEIKNPSIKKLDKPIKNT